MQLRLCALVCAVLLSVALCSLQCSPTTAISKAAVQAIPMLCDAITQVQLDDINTVMNLIIAKVDLSLTEIDGEFATVENVGFSTIPSEDAVQLVIDDISMRFSFNWSYEQEEWPYTHDHGTGTLDIAGTSYTTALQSYMDEECGVPQFECLKYTMDLGKVTINLDGGASALYQMVIDTLINLVESLFEDTLEDMLQEVAMDSINHAFMHTDYLYHMVDSPALSLDERFTNKFAIYEDWLQVTLTGYFYPESVGHLWNGRTLPAGPLPGKRTNADIQIFCGRSLHQSAFEAHQYEEDYVCPIDYSDASPYTQSILTTAALGSVAPGLYQQYPDQSLSVTYTSTETPQLTYMPSGALVSFTGRLDFYVAETAVGTPVMSLETTFGFSAIPGIDPIDQDDNTPKILFNWAALQMYTVTPPTLITSTVGDVNTASPMFMQWQSLLGIYAVAPWMLTTMNHEAPRMNTIPDLNYDEAEFAFDPEYLSWYLPLQYLN
ncbi:hypothetical protein KIPB_000977 [Kipferlia bialata]|uniref:Lipid-binding serum glycoprotein C-terminal domain-containing protein n=1 Tax=Kipferlia bialata TaxID=797122 RepID=A0A9K3GFF9_9EUKA|nr:hypothetical protein KIPB_000977 [Kipferlia bialata]|eukprot:g977.t1